MQHQVDGVKAPPCKLESNPELVTTELPPKASFFWIFFGNFWAAKGGWDQRFRVQFWVHGCRIDEPASSSLQVKFNRRYRSLLIVLWLTL
jgi:hypothetical protein